MYDGVVTPEFMDDYGQVQNGDYNGPGGYNNRCVYKYQEGSMCLFNVILPSNVYIKVCDDHQRINRKSPRVASPKTTWGVFH